MSSAGNPVLSVRSLCVDVRASGHWHRAVDDVSFDVGTGETLCVVGESGCGKSLTAKSILRLLDTSPAIRVRGSVELSNRNLLSLSAAEMRKVRGERIAMIFQEPMTALNPVLTAGEQIGETLRHHGGMSRAAERAEVLRLMDLVRIPESHERIDRYPHELSGGMRQRVMIAAAVACRPQVLIADEPTTALDVTNQARILDLLRDLQRDVGMALVLITHDLGVVAHVADRVAVMYAGEIVELAPVDTLLRSPVHPYSEALLRSIPRADRDQVVLETIPGQVPPLGSWSLACRFADRCSIRETRCDSAHPALTAIEVSHSAARCLVRTHA